MKAVLEAVGVTRSFGRGPHQVKALDAVSCTVERGRTLGIVGSSGSGKSTLGEILGGLQKPDRGEVLFEGVPLASLGRRERSRYRRSVQFVFQDPQASMDPGYTVRQVIGEPLEMMEKGLPATERDERVRVALGHVGLGPEVLPKRAAELSGGQCQRVAVARALVTHPAVVICDECTSALDVSVQAQILNLLRDLQREFDTGYVFISHNIAVVGYMADDLIVLRDGSTVESGPAEQVLTSPREEYTRRLVEAARLREGWRPYGA